MTSACPLVALGFSEPPTDNASRVPTCETGSDPRAQRRHPRPAPARHRRHPRGGHRADVPLGALRHVHPGRPPRRAGPEPGPRAGPGDRPGQDRAPRADRAAAAAAAGRALLRRAGDRPGPARPGRVPDGHRAAHRRGLRPALERRRPRVGTVEVRAAAVRVRGQGLVVKTTKTDAGTLVLPRWCVAMLRDRAARRTATTDDRAGRPVFPAPWVDGAIPPTPRPTCGTPSPPPASTGSPPTSSARPWPP